MSQTVPRQLAFITLYLAGLVAAPSRGELLGAALSPASAGRVFMSCGAVRDNLRDQICSARYILLQKKQRSPSLKVSSATVSPRGRRAQGAARHVQAVQLPQTGSPAAAGVPSCMRDHFS
jgi:hypothetical protein